MKFDQVTPCPLYELFENLHSNFNLFSNCVFFSDVIVEILHLNYSISEIVRGYFFLQAYIQTTQNFIKNQLHIFEYDQGQRIKHFFYWIDTWTWSQSTRLKKQPEILLIQLKFCIFNYWMTCRNDNAKLIGVINRFQGQLISATTLLTTTKWV